MTPRVSASTAGESPSGETLRSVGRSAGVRVLLLPVGGILGIIVTRLIIDNYGSEAFAHYGLLVTVGTLLPFADLGMAAAVMNAVGGSRDPAADSHVRRTITTSVRILILSAGVMLVLITVISVGGLWPRLLGEGLLANSGPTAATVCLALIAITLPIGIGQRILSGLGKNHLTVLLVGLQTPIVLLTLIVLINLGVGDGSYVPVVPYVATLIISLAALWLASRKMRPAVGVALRDVPRLRSAPGTKVFDVGLPMLIQMIALPIAMQSDRLVLSHIAGTEQLARYNLAAQMYLPVWQVTSAAGVALWPIFARARSGAGRAPSPLSIAAGFGGAAAIVCLVIGLSSPWLSRLASGGAIQLPIELVVVFSLFMVVQAAKYPLGMYLTDAAGLRFQAAMVVLMLPVNLGLSLTLARPLGALGPVLGSLIGVAVFQLGANFVYVRRALAKTSA